MKTYKTIPFQVKFLGALAASSLMATPALAISEDAKVVLQLLVTKGVITQKDYDDTIQALESKPAEGVPPVQFVQDALGVKATEVQKAVEYTQKDEKKGSVAPGGFGLLSADGQHSVNLTGMVHYDYRNITSGLPASKDKDSASSADTFSFRRTRIGVNGYVYKDIEYELIASTTGSDTNLVDTGFVNFAGNKSAQVRVGKFRQPYSLESMTKDGSIDFMERSYGDQLGPQKLLGAMVGGEPKKGFTYGASYAQAGFNELTNSDAAGGLATGRVTANLGELANLDNKVVHFGVSTNRGRYEVLPTTTTDAGTTAAKSQETRATLLSYRSENQGLANAYRVQIGGDKLASGGYGLAANNVATVDKGLNNLEFAATAGALKFQYEAASLTLDATAPNITTGGTPGTTKTASLSLKSTTQYYEVFYNLTGESWADAYKGGSFTGIKPHSNYVFGKGGTGAWQLGVRVSQYKASLPGFVTIANDGGNNLSRAENSEKAKTITYGLNWLLNPNSRVMFNYATTQFDRPVYLLSSTDTTNRSSRENIFSIRTQINF